MNLSEEKGSDKKGTRGMTVIARTDSKRWHRITVHNKSTESPDHWNSRVDKWVEAANQRLQENLGVDPSNLIKDEFKKRRVLARFYRTMEENSDMPQKSISIEKLVDSYDKSRENMKAEMGQAIDNLGQFIEVMYKNHYISLVHVKDIGASARNNLLEASKKIPHTSFGGDTNLQISSSKFKNHKYEHKINNELTAKMSTMSFVNSNDSNFDISGKIASGNVAHDGIVIRSELDAAYKILGTRWAMHDYKGETILSSDHKGILISINPSLAPKLEMATPS